MGDSNCPQCQNLKKELWIDKMQHHLLPVKHYHLIFTIPHELNDLIFYNQATLYNLLFKSSWKTIQQITGPGTTGMVSTLHSWGSNLSFHPHLHCIVPEGKLLNNKWEVSKGSSRGFYCDSKQLRTTFKQIFIVNLVKLLEEDALYINEDKQGDRIIYLRKLLRTINRKKWNVRIETPILGVKQIIEYLGRYIKRVALTNSRIQEVTASKVVLNYKQYALQKPGKPAPIATIDFDGPAFIQRFTQHILPPYFQRVRYYGLYAFAAKVKKAIAYELLTNQVQISYTKPLKRQLLKRMLGVDPDCCPECNVYNSMTSLDLDPTDKFYIKIIKHWHNIRVKLRRDKAFNP